MKQRHKRRFKHIQSQDNNQTDQSERSTNQ